MDSVAEVLAIVFFLGIFLVAFVLVRMVFSFFFGNGLEKHEKSFLKELYSMEEFDPHQTVFKENWMSSSNFMGVIGVSFDEGRKKLCLIKVGNKMKIDPHLYEYKDILSSQIFEDGETITKTARGSQIGGALLGAVVAGGVGAVIGGLSGSKTSSVGKVKRIDLRLTVNKVNNPIIDINFLNKKVEKEDGVYDSSMEEARHWQGIFEIAIRRADMEDITVVKSNGELEEDTQKALPKSFIADELLKLGELKDKGLLTDDEFEDQKSKLLAGTGL